MVAALEIILVPLGAPVLLLKGSAYALGDSPAAPGRMAGDIDLLMPRSWLGAAEIALARAGWRMQAKSAYDERYYREWMHELPPIVAPDGSNVLDLHHNILPLTSRLSPDADALIAARVPVPGSGFCRLCPADEVIHSAVHLAHDGDLAGGLRNLHDLHRLLREHPADSAFWQSLEDRARLHGVGLPLWQALTLAAEMFDTPVPERLLNTLRPRSALSGGLFGALARMQWRGKSIGRLSAGAACAGQALYIRSHLLRMPPMLLLRHLWIKWRMRA
jgi:hypothetical protein